jgi:hypothetical protein
MSKGERTMPIVVFIGFEIVFVLGYVAGLCSPKVSTTK